VLTSATKVQAEKDALLLKLLQERSEKEKGLPKIKDLGLDSIKGDTRKDWKAFKTQLAAALDDAKVIGQEEFDNVLRRATAVSEEKNRWMYNLLQRKLLPAQVNRHT
jgi:hypothetical protein